MVTLAGRPDDDVEAPAGRQVGISRSAVW
jgi:hypothetical protein